MIRLALRFFSYHVQNVDLRYNCNLTLMPGIYEMFF